MPEETGQSSEAQVTPETPPTQTEVKEPTVVAPESTLPERFRGKTASEIAQSYVEAESHIGKLATQNQQMAQRLQMLEDSARQTPDQPSPYEDMYINDPLKATDRMIADRLAQFQQQQAYSSAFDAAPLAKLTAQMQSKQLFDTAERLGVSRDIDNMITQGIQSGAINPAMAKQPQAYTWAAWQLVGQKVGFDPARMPGIAHTASQPIETGTPTMNKRAGMETVSGIPSQWGEAWDKMGLSKKDQESIVAKYKGGE